MKKFDTIYILRDPQTGALLKYASYVLAPDLNRALKKVEMRNIGEEIQSQGRSYEEDELTNAVALYDKGHYKHCLHAVTFMSYVLVSAGRINAESLLSDIGIIHELIHIITDCVTTPSPLIREMIVRFQNSYDSISH